MVVGVGSNFYEGRVRRDGRRVLRGRRRHRVSGATTTVRWLALVDTRLDGCSRSVPAPWRSGGAHRPAPHAADTRVGRVDVGPWSTRRARDGRLRSKAGPRLGERICARLQCRCTLYAAAGDATRPSPTSGRPAFPGPDSETPPQPHSRRWGGGIFLRGPRRPLVATTSSSRLPWLAGRQVAAALRELPGVQALVSPGRREQVSLT